MKPIPLGDNWTAELELQPSERAVMLLLTDAAEDDCLLGIPMDAATCLEFSRRLEQAAECLRMEMGT